MALILYQDGTQEAVSLPDDDLERLAYLQKIVGGYVGRLPSPDGKKSLLANENGLHITGIEINQQATHIASAWWEQYYPLLGNVILVDNDGERFR